MRRVGGDVYWRDYGWWDIAGNWQGPDFAEAGGKQPEKIDEMLDAARGVVERLLHP